MYYVSKRVHKTLWTIYRMKRVHASVDILFWAHPSSSHGLFVYIMYCSLFSHKRTDCIALCPSSSDWPTIIIVMHKWITEPLPPQMNPLSFSCARKYYARISNRYTCWTDQNRVKMGNSTFGPLSRGLLRHCEWLTVKTRITAKFAWTKKPLDFNSAKLNASADLVSFSSISSSTFSFARHSRDHNSAII